jgi:hypothetical protein
VAAERVADLGAGAVAVVGGGVDDHGAPPAVALVADLLEVLAAESPVPFLMARSMLSLGMFTPRAFSMARRRRGFAVGSPPPMPAAIEISRMIWVKILPRLASAAPFLRLMRPLRMTGHQVPPGIRGEGDNTVPR